MFVGVFVGTYSSIYIGTAFALWRGLNRQDFIVQVKPNLKMKSLDCLNETIKPRFIRGFFIWFKNYLRRNASEIASTSC